MAKQAKKKQPPEVALLSGILLGAAVAGDRLELDAVRDALRVAAKAYRQALSAGDDSEAAMEALAAIVQAQLLLMTSPKQKRRDVPAPAETPQGVSL